MYAQAVELLVARGLTLWQGQTRLFAPVDLTLRTGSRLALTGHAGSGKGAFLQMLAGRRAPAEGSVRRAPGVQVILVTGDPYRQADGSVKQVALAGLDRLRDLEKQLRDAEKQLDTPEALENYAKLASDFDSLGGYTAEAELLDLLDDFGLSGPLLAAVPSTLSGGQRKRLALAVALAQRPEVLLLDSPEAGLDAEARDLLVQRLGAHAGALLFSSHDRDFINRTAREVAELSGAGLRIRRGGFPLRSHRAAPAETGGRRLLLSASPLKVPVGDNLIHAPELSLHKGDKVLLQGSNGSGKSTLLVLIAHDLHHGHGTTGLNWHGRVRLRHIDQRDCGLETGLSALENLELLMSGQRARQLLGLVRLAPDRWELPADRLDRSELARAGLALVLADESDLLLVDELDVGLDLAGLQLLEDNLLARPGAVVLVTHDRQLARNFALRVWSLGPDGLSDYRGGMEGFRSGRRRREPDLVTAPEEHPADPAQPGLEELEDALAEVELKLADREELGPRQLQRLQRRHRELVSSLAELHDSRFDPPAPRFRVREAGLLIEADLTDDGVGLRFSSLQGSQPQISLSGGVAHLRVEVPADRCLLPWALAALVNGATRLAFYALPVRVVQYWNPEPPAGLLLEPAGEEWHALSLPAFEKQEGWTGAEQPQRRRPRRRRR